MYPYTIVNKSAEVFEKVLQLTILKKPDKLHIPFPKSTSRPETASNFVYLSLKVMIDILPTYHRYNGTYLSYEQILKNIYKLPKCVYHVIFIHLCGSYLNRPVTGGGWCAHAGILGLLTFFASSRPLFYN